MWIIKNSDGTPDKVVTDETDELFEGQSREAGTETEIAAAQAKIAYRRRLDEYRVSRAARYESEASAYELVDAETKLASSDPAEQAEGAAQKATVLARRMEIKAAIPKP